MDVEKAKFTSFKRGKRMFVIQPLITLVREERLQKAKRRTINVGENSSTVKQKSKLKSLRNCRK
jgi:hypothetical protein